MPSFTFKKNMKITIIFIILSLISGLYTNCSQGFNTLDAVSSPSSSQVLSSTPATCLLPTGAVEVGTQIQGYLANSATFPNLCGALTNRTCLKTGNFDGSLPLFPACSQRCIHPDTQKEVPANEPYVYYTVASGATQSICDAAGSKVTSICQASTGQFFPLPPAVRFATCKVQGQTCAYPTAAGYAVPSPAGNLLGATVTGYSQQAATYPALCGNVVTRTCGADGSWGGTVPLYTSCAQNCFDPVAKMAYGINQGPIYWSLSKGTQAECDKAKVQSICGAKGLFIPEIPVTAFSSCAITQVTPPTISNFVASPAIIAAGQASTLTWAVSSNATSLNLSGIGDVTGKTSQVVGIGTYTLTAKNSAGSATATLTVSLQMSNSGPVKIMPFGDSITAATCYRSYLWKKFQDNKNTNVDFVGAGTGNAPNNGNDCGVSASFDPDHNGHSCYAITDFLNPAGSGTKTGCATGDSWYGDERDIKTFFQNTNPDIVLWHIGTNDIWGAGSNFDPTRILQAYSVALAAIRARNPKVIILVAQILPMEPSPLSVPILNKAIPIWANQNSTANSKIIVVDQYTGFDLSMTHDGVHPNSVGSQWMADHWYAALLPYLK